ncbi:cell division protein FtsB [Endozoicomonas sp. SM1973]|uniref:Cell division protein FtsB n=1 Tax=Spartinivicinus marinus TaxID=2994442 RepID=A0A853HYA1_9GAMM|nr:cell division protein FtsB [Spartinivicinus marinus]MCX4025432.1 cell division protein FtsB [Spartinivicinus marinus]NYZ65339.1 cell division protein FtsB [Spartinivicinus marinus]
MKWLTGLLILLLVLLQYRLWFSNTGVVRLWQTQQQITSQQRENQGLYQRNRVLEAEVVELQSGLDTIEELARSQLGMIKQGEQFFLIAD